MRILQVVELTLLPQVLFLWRLSYYHLFCPSLISKLNLLMAIPPFSGLTQLNTASHLTTVALTVIGSGTLLNLMVTG